MKSVPGERVEADLSGRSWSSTWAGYAAAAWAIVFAVRGIYWALGGTVGLGTLSQGIQQAAAAGDPDLFAALWATVALEVVAATLGFALVRPWGRAVPRRVPIIGGRRAPVWLLLIPAWGAGTLLAGHGSLFVSFGLLAAGGAIAPTPEIQWYALFCWGPWFLLGGVLFMAAGRADCGGCPTTGSGWWRAFSAPSAGSPRPPPLTSRPSSPDACPETRGGVLRSGGVGRDAAARPPTTADEWENQCGVGKPRGAVASGRRGTAVERPIPIDLSISIGNCHCIRHSDGDRGLGSFR